MLMKVVIQMITQPQVHKKMDQQNKKATNRSIKAKIQNQ